MRFNDQILRELCEAAIRLGQMNAHKHLEHLFALIEQEPQCHHSEDCHDEKERAND